MSEQLQTNPLIHNGELPSFSAILPQHVLPAVQSTLAECRQRVEQIISQDEPFTWENLCQPLAESDEHFSRVWSPISHLNAVKNSTELREAYEQCLPLISDYTTWIGQHEGLYQAYLQVKQGAQFSKLEKAQQKAVENVLRDFKLSGVSLPPEQKKRYGEIVARLTELASRFSNNVLDATMGWSKLISQQSELTGLPVSALAAARELAESKQQQGWLFTLDIPSYLPIITYCDNRQLRSEIYRAFITRASEQGPNAGQWDNSEIMSEELALRHELAQLLGFSTYADKSLATKMAESTNQVLDFLHDLAKRSKPQGEEELLQLRQFARTHFNVTELEPWDISYYSEKQKQYLYSIDDEQLRPYFPQERVLQGLFEVIRRLFGVEVKERQGVDVWHPDVQFYDLYNSDNQCCAGFYLDLYAREHKRGGAWMDELAGKMRFAKGHQQLPIAYLTCNFNRPLGDKPALFTHDEVTTLFHEFGHGLHHMLTRIETPGVAGINGVPWDAVELPSQFLENWCWQQEALAFISGHYETGEPLPQAMLDQLLAARNYQTALFVLRQLEFGLFDFRLHSEYDPAKGARILPTLADVKREVAVICTPQWARFPHAFSHIFAGGYAAGYYSYLWAEVLSADAFSRFEEEGIFNPETGQSFLNAILSQGGVDEPMTLFKQFRGRAPKLDAMLRHYGIKG